MLKIAEEHQKHIREHIQGIGRLAIGVQVNGKSYYLPKNHFLLYKNAMSDKKMPLSAFCIETGLELSGKTPEDAITSLLETCRIEYQEVIRSYSSKKNGRINYDQLLDQLELHNDEGYWKIYRQVNLKNSLKQVKTADQPEILFDVLKEQAKKFSEQYAQLYNKYKDLVTKPHRQEKISPHEQIFEKELNISCGTYEFFPVAS